MSGPLYHLVPAVHKGSPSDEREHVTSKTPKGSTVWEKALPQPNDPTSDPSLAPRARHSRHEWLRRVRPEWTIGQGGWRQTIMIGTVVCVLVMLSNLAILCWGWTRPIDPSTSQRLLAEGDCGMVQRVSTYWHLAINVFSTLLLATSNGAMQCLNAPTREALDNAHARGIWLDVGISGFRNWWYMDRWRKWCWIVLVLSSVPLHLVYNSAVFPTISATEYWAVAVAPDFFNGANFSVPDQSTFAAREDGPPPLLETFQNLYELAANGSLQRLENKDCISTYSQTLLTTYSNVLLVASPADSSGNSSVLRYYYHEPVPSWESGVPIYGPNWICGVSDADLPCDFQYFQDHADEWNVTAAVNRTLPETNPPVEQWAPPIHVEYCLAQPVQPMCNVQMIPEIMLIVLVANIFKVFCFLATFRIRSFKPLVTLGDCLASYLEHPDPHTKHLGPLSAQQIRLAIKRRRRGLHLYAFDTHSNRPIYISGEATDYSFDGRSGLAGRLPLELGPWKEKRLRWFSGASKTRWFSTYSVLVFLWLGVLAGLLMFIITGEGGSFKTQLSAGFGNISPSSLTTGGENPDLVGIIICANLPQILISIIYLSLNGLWTCILLSREFTLFAKQRMALRVTEPTGPHQKSSYWFSLPYRFSLPLMALCWAMHWAMSQTLFLAEVNVISPDPVPQLALTLTVMGYSTLSWMILMVISGVAIVATLSLGWIRFHGGAPLVESYSLAISAMCHPPPGKENPALQLLKYGAVDEREYGGENGQAAMREAPEQISSRQRAGDGESRGVEEATLLQSSKRASSPPRVRVWSAQNTAGGSPSALRAPDVNGSGSYSYGYHALQSGSQQFLHALQNVSHYHPYTFHESTPPLNNTVGLPSNPQYLAQPLVFAPPTNPPPKCTLIATLSDGEVEPLVAPNTYTPLSALYPL